MPVRPTSTRRAKNAARVLRALTHDPAKRLKIRAPQLSWCQETVAQMLGYAGWYELDADATRTSVADPLDENLAQAEFSERRRAQVERLSCRLRALGFETDYPTAREWVRELAAAVAPSGRQQTPPSTDPDIFSLVLECQAEQSGLLRHTEDEIMGWTPDDPPWSDDLEEVMAGLTEREDGELTRARERGDVQEVARILRQKPYAVDARLTYAFVLGDSDERLAQCRRAYDVTSAAYSHLARARRQFGRPVDFAWDVPERELQQPIAALGQELMTRRDAASLNEARDLFTRGLKLIGGRGDRYGVRDDLRLVKSRLRRLATAR
jgi:hypothetical protein